jgi:MoxR-like ATPase
MTELTTTVLAAAQKHAQELRERVLEPLRRTFVGKQEVVDVLGVCLVASEHAFLYGPPGTAKSAIVNELARRLDGQVFSYLLTRFTEPSELFGPFDIRKLRDGELVSNTEGMLPEASMVFLDELLNANSAILNSLLTVLNERVFRRGRDTRRLPLLMVVGASNHLPEDDALGALFDRFLMRVVCDNAPADRLGEVLHAGWRLEASRLDQPETMSVEVVRSLHAALTRMPLEEVHTAFVALVQSLRRAGIKVSDRRAVKMQRLVAASALLAGRTAPLPSDLWVFRHIWDTEEQREVLASLVRDAMGSLEGDKVHPAARHADHPDPEELAKDLQQLAAECEQAVHDEGLRARWTDRLRALAARCEWVRGDEARSVLQARVEELWAAVSNE